MNFEPDLHYFLIAYALAVSIAAIVLRKNGFWSNWKSALVAGGFLPFVVLAVTLMGLAGYALVALFGGQSLDLSGFIFVGFGAVFFAAVFGLSGIATAWLVLRLFANR